MLWYSVNIFIILIFILLFLITRKSNKRWSKINDYLGKVTSTVNSVRYGNLATKIEQFNHPSYQNLTESINRMVETLNDREQMIVEYQAELMRQNKFLEAVINSLSDGILIVDENYKILRATPKIGQWFGIRGSEIIDKDLFDFIKIADNVKIEKLNSTEIFIKNNNLRNFLASVMKMTLDDKKKRFVILVKDITNEKELETLKEDFVATLTHDLKVPIVAESNMLDFFLAEKFGTITDKQRVALLNMKTSNQELVDLVQILLETYKIKETGVELDKENIMLIEFLKEIINEMLPIADKSGLKINFKHRRNLKVYADRMQLKRVVKNLIQNALSHSDTSKNIDIKFGEIPGFVTISIIDYGKGISAEDIKMIFNKYYSTAKKFRKLGTGLGLYLSKQIVKSHNGDITVTSEENVSTEFCIKLPC